MSVDWRTLLANLINGMEWQDSDGSETWCKCCYSLLSWYKQGVELEGNHEDDCLYMLAKRTLEEVAG
jgi:hypothetical protein